jgi:hypothetical protein
VSDLDRQIGWMLAALAERDRNAGLKDTFSKWAGKTNERIGLVAFRMGPHQHYNLIVWKDPARWPEFHGEGFLTHSPL